MRVKDLIPNPDGLLTRNYWLEVNAIATRSEVRDREQDRRALLGGALRRGTQDRGAQGSGAEERASQQQNGEAQQDSGGRESLRDALPAAQALQPDSFDGRDDFAPGSPAKNGTEAVTEATTSEFREDIIRNMSEIDWDYAVIQRINPRDLTMHLVPFNLGRLLLKGDESNNLALEPGDILTIFSQADLTVPVERRTKFVRLEGEFQASGVYQAEPGETLRGLVARVGGSTPGAYFYGAEFTRETVRMRQQKGLDELADSLERDIARNAALSTGLTPDDATEKKMELEAQRQMADKLGQVKASGRVVLELKPGAAGVDALPNMTLEDGDRLVLPHRPSTVDVLGAVYNNNSFFYRPGKRLGDYLKQAGGATREADKAHIFVIRANGSVLSKQSVSGLWSGGFDALRLLPGDAIVVPPRLVAGTKLRALRDWTQVFAQFALGVAAVRTLN